MIFQACFSQMAQHTKGIKGIIQHHATMWAVLTWTYLKFEHQWFYEPHLSRQSLRCRAFDNIYIIKGCSLASPFCAMAQKRRERSEGGLSWRPSQQLWAADKLQDIALLRQELWLASIPCNLTASEHLYNLSCTRGVIYWFYRYLLETGFCGLSQRAQHVSDRNEGTFSGQLAIAEVSAICFET